jgi:hypothetical protein
MVTSPVLAKAPVAAVGIPFDGQFLGHQDVIGG